MKSKSMLRASLGMLLCVAAIGSTPIATRVSAEEPKPVVVYDKERGELSPGTQAPKREQMVNAAKSATPTALYAMLEYGERVECFECIPLLADKLLSSGDPQVREISAWWLRQRSFGFGPVMVHMKDTIANNTDPVMRSRAAEALGEFLDPHALSALSKAAQSDSDTTVRASAVRALGRLDANGGNTVISAALGDKDAVVRRTAINQVLKVNFFHDDEAVMGRLADDDAEVRRAAAQISGELKIAASVDPLLGLLMTDENAQVRQAAAIALGRIGGSDAAAAIADARKDEKDQGVLDALDVARRMQH